MSNLSTSSAREDERNFDAELEYTYNFFPFLKADSLMLAALLQGVRPSTDIVTATGLPGPLAYCELGCGQGLTLNILAAGDETGRYFGVDYNAAQIKNASSMARDAGLSNVEFIEESFANLDARDLPDFDIIALHGIYSWISANLRQDIVDFLKRKLKPGGLCFISYNCTIGRGSDLAFRQLLQTALRREDNPSPDAISKSLAVAQAFADKGARYFTQNAGTVERLKDARGRSPIAWNHPDLSVPSNLRSIFDGFHSPADQELLKGIWSNQPFRRDIYVKGAPNPVSLDEQATILKSLHFGLARARANCPLKVAVPAGVANLPENPFTALLDALEKASVSGAELRQHLPGEDIGDRDFVRALIILLGAEYMELRTPADRLAKVRQRFDRLNAAVGRSTDRSQDVFVAATAKNRNAIKMSPVNYYLYRAHQTGPENRVSNAYRLLKESGRSVYYKGQAVKDRKMAEMVIAEQEPRFVANILPRL